MMSEFKVRKDYKSQAPISLPAAGRQINSNYQGPNCLAIGIWLLGIIWDLELGIWLFPIVEMIFVITLRKSPHV